MEQVEKVVVYITRNDELLVFRHKDYPNAGIQVPSGTVQDGETPIQAAFREVFEETCLKNLNFKSYLGDDLFDSTSIGNDKLYHRHFFHLECHDAPLEWTHFEKNPSEGPKEPICFEFYWANLNNMPNLAGEQGKMISRIGVFK